MASGYRRRPRAGALIAAVTVALSGLSGVPSAAGPVAGAAEPLVARQGARMFVDNLGGSNITACTIGYNDPTQRRSYTAGHCAVPGDHAPRGGSLVYLADDAGRQMTTAAGIIYPAAAYYGPTNANDWSVVYWFQNVGVGRNTFGGTYTSIDAIAPGETLCYHSYAPAGQLPRAACGPFVGMIEKTIYFDAPGTPAYGDSGGPVYAPGRGLVGVLSGANALVDEADNEVVSLERASSLQSGPLYDAARIDAFLHAYYNRHRPPASTSTPATSVSLLAPGPQPGGKPAGSAATPPVEVEVEGGAPPPDPAEATSVESSPDRLDPSAPSAPSVPAVPTAPAVSSSPPRKGAAATPTSTAAPVPTGAATPANVPSEAPKTPKPSKDRAKEHDRRVADALVITLGVVAAVAVLVPAIGYVLGFIR